VQTKDVEIPPTMQRATAKEAEANREKRARIINRQYSLLGLLPLLSLTIFLIELKN
jgi:hypothetical protein